MNFILIDNYDSFTYLIKSYFEILDIHIHVIKNNDMDVLGLERYRPDALVISPGPGNPDGAGYTLELLHRYHTEYPVLGVCLGHQSLAQFFGGNIITASQIMHGKQSEIFHNQQGLFQNMSQPFMATRYHSLVVDPVTLPACFDTTAWAIDQNNDINSKNVKVIMGIQHKTYPLYGVQFHPEAILTQQGLQIFENFIHAVLRWQREI